MKTNLQIGDSIDFRLNGIWTRGILERVQGTRAWVRGDNSKDTLREIHVLHVRRIPCWLRDALRAGKAAR